MKRDSEEDSLRRCCESTHECPLLRSYVIMMSTHSWHQEYEDKDDSKAP